MLSFSFRHRRAVEIASLDKRAAKASDIHEVMRIMQNSPTATFLRDCTFSERVMLASLMKCIKREGVEAIPWADVSVTANSSHSAHKLFIT